MNPRLVILTGTLAGQVRALGPARLTLGRDASSDIRFDPDRDSDVSARHAELSFRAGIASVRDANSTNGVYVNGRRVRDNQTLADGDVLRLGADGPQIRYEQLAAESNAKGSTTERLAVAVSRQMRLLRIVLGAAFLLAAVAAVAVWESGRAGAERDTEMVALRRRNDSLSVAIDRDMRAMTGRLAGLDAALAGARQESDRLRTRLAQGAPADSVTLLAERLGHAETRRGAISAAAQMDYEAIARTSGRAVVMIAVQMPDGTLYSGSGVGVSADGVILTNRHLIRGNTDDPPQRIAVIYADTRDWLPAHVERVAADADLAMLRIDRRGPFPFIDRVATRAAAVGAPVAIIGYPLGAGTPMDGGRDRIIARSTLGVGTVSKSIPSVLQIDAFALEGSSGSPVFAGDGSIAGLVYGGAPAAAGRIVYAVPSGGIRALLK